MAIADPIANFLTVIRNAYRAKHEEATSPASNQTVRIAEILKSERFIKDFRVVEEEGKRFVRIHLRYMKNGRPALRHLSRVSKPGLRQYRDVTALPKVKNGIGVAIISTSKGMMTDHEARKQNVGGEILCKAY